MDFKDLKKEGAITTRDAEMQKAIDDINYGVSELIELRIEVNKKVSQELVKLDISQQKSVTSDSISSITQTFSNQRDTSKVHTAESKKRADITFNSERIT